MYTVQLTETELNNLLAFLTGKGRIQLSGDEAFEFVRIVGLLMNAQKEETT